MNVTRTARAARTAAARFVSKYNFALRSTGLALAIVLWVSVPLVAILTAPSRAPQEPADAMYWVTGAFVVIPMYFTGVATYLNTDIKTRIVLPFSAGVLTSVASAMFTSGMPRNVAIAMIGTALIGAAAGYLVGLLVPNAAYRGSLTYAARRRFPRLARMY